MGEFGSCHRNEPSGTLHGIMRIRGFTQDDAHIFCTPEQVQEEVSACVQMVYDMYQTFGFKHIALSCRRDLRNEWVRMKSGTKPRLHWSRL